MSAMERIRVAFIVNRLEMGGLERCVTRLVNHLPDNQFETAVICLDKTGSAEDWIEKPTKIIELHKGTGNSVRVVARLRSTLRDWRPHVVHSHNWGTLIETTLAKSKIPHLHAERGTVLGTTRSGGLKWRLKARAMLWALRRCSAVMSNADAVAARVTACCGFPRERIAIIPNGIATLPLDGSKTEARSRVRAEFGIPPNGFVVGSVGRLNPVKGFELPIEAIAHSPAPSQTHFLLVGDGEQRKSLEAILRDAPNRNQIHFAGARENVADFLAAMDLYVNSSHSEGMSQSIVEAMSLGLPLLTSDVGDNRKLVAGDVDGGVVLESRDTARWRETIEQMKSDPELLSAYACNAKRNFDANYTIDTMIQRFSALYTGIARAS